MSTSASAKDTFLLSDKAKLRLGHLLIAVNVLGVILTGITLNSDLYKRELDDNIITSSNTKEETRITLWKVIHCVYPTIPNTPAAGLDSSNSEASSVAAAVSKVSNISADDLLRKRKQQKLLLMNEGAPATNNADDASTRRQSYCTFDRIVEGDIQWPNGLIHQFHAVLSLLIVALFCRFVLLVFFWFVGGNAVKFTGASSITGVGGEDESLPSSLAPSFSAEATAVVDGAQHAVPSLAPRPHTCEGMVVSIAYAIVLVSISGALAVEGHLATGANLKGAHLNRHASSSNWTVSSSDDSANDSGFQGAGFVAMTGAWVLLFSTLFEIIVVLICTCVFVPRAVRKFRRQAGKAESVSQPDQEMECRLLDSAGDVTVPRIERQKEVRGLSLSSVDFDTSLSPQYTEDVVSLQLPQNRSAQLPSPPPNCYIPPVVCGAGEEPSEAVIAELKAELAEAKLRISQLECPRPAVATEVPTSPIEL